MSRRFCAATRDVEVRAVAVDDDEPCVGNQAAQDQRGAREETAADDRDSRRSAFEAPGARQQITKRAFVYTDEEALEPG